MSRNKVYFRTRSVGFLWKSALIVALAIIGIGSLVSLLNDQKTSAVHRMLDLTYVEEEYELGQDQGTLLKGEINAILCDCLTEDRPFYEKLDDLQMVVWLMPEMEEQAFPESDAVSCLSSNEHGLAQAFWDVCRESATNRFFTADQLKSSDAAGRLNGFADRQVKYANFALALSYQSLDAAASEQALKREIELFGEDAMRERLVGFYLDGGKFDKLAALADNPDYEPYIDRCVVQEIALSRMDWPVLVRNLIPAAYENVNVAMVVLALVSGLIWMMIVLRFNGNPSIRSASVQLALPALLLGALSAHATILFIFWQEHQLGLGMGTDALGQLAYCLGIGFREEGLKLLFFCPLIPFLRRKTDLEILTVAGLVGLGFAIEENINYFEGSAGLAALGRFATANFLHISLTAMGGLSLARAFVHQGRDIQHAAVTFASIVAFHGLYDAFLIVGLLTDYAWLSFTVFVLLGHQYFGWLRHLRDEWRDPVSITTVFTLGVVVVTGLSYCLYAWQFGILEAFLAVSGEAFGIALILIMFYRGIPETLHK